jgi:aspartate/tyrosine/aromatic aminotransferase
MPTTKIAIDASHVSFEHLAENMESFSGLTIMVSNPCVCDGTVPLDYFVTKDNFQSLLDSAQKHNVTMIFQLALAGLGTKSSQNKKLLKKFSDEKTLAKKVKSVPKEMKRLIKKKTLYE